MAATGLLLMSAGSAFAASSDEPVRFAVLGDRTGGHTPGVYEDIIREIERLKPDFTINVGDMIEGYTADTVEVKRQWDEYIALLKPLTAPVHLTPGNHDIWGEPGDPSLDFYHRYAGPPYRSFDYQGVHFVILDNSRWESSNQIPQEQIDWLSKDLKASRKARQTLVFFHKPFWFESLALGKPDRLHDIFKANGVDAVFTGHFHIYFCGEYDGIKYTSIGSSGGATSPGITGLMYHFGWVTINAEGIHIALIKKGSVLPWEEVTAEDLHTVNRIEAQSVWFESPVKVTDESPLTDVAWEFRLRNLNPKATLSDTLRWELPNGWSIRPAYLPVRLPPGDSLMVSVYLTATGPLYPAPKFTIRMPYKVGGDFELTRPVMLSRETICWRAERTLNIDGVVEEAVWSSPVSRLYGPSGDEPATDETRFYFAYDQEHLYLAAICRESQMDMLAAKIDKPDGPVYGEDCVGYFLTPPQVADTVFNYQIYFNPNGIPMDQRISVAGGVVAGADLKWSGTYEVKTTRNGDNWTLEAAIPLAALGVESAQRGDEWQVNFRRKQKRVNSSADWQVPISYDPATYGRLVYK